MAQEIIQSATWPGVPGVESATYVCSHGISPGRFVLTTYPQYARPAEYGNLTFTDGRRTLVVRGCKADRITPQWSGAGGTTFLIEGSDERWQWPSLGGVSGHYNRRDAHGKLVPWTIRSPQELARILFGALAIRNGVVQFPAGVVRAAGANADRLLKAGENFFQFAVNPEVTWDHTPPAEALAGLAEQLGCRVIYQPAAARVLVVPIGKGRPFPSLPYEVLGATVSAPVRPAYIGVFGQPVKIQSRWLLEAVGEEWDGTYIPINQLSYAPVGKEQIPQRSDVRYVGGGGVENLAVTLSFTDPKSGALVRMSVNHTGGATVAQRLNGIKSKMEVNPDVVANFTIVFDGATRLKFTGRTPFPFSLTCFNPAGGAESFVAEDVVKFKKAATGGWDYSNPPTFWNVQPTARLSFSQARALAQKTVYRCYRILNRDPHDFSPPDRPGRPMALPWWGKVARRQQVVLQDTMVEQVEPRPRIAGAIDKGNQGRIDVAGQGALPEFYNGYSRYRAAVVYGSVYKKLGTVNWLFNTKDKAKETWNTEPDARVFVPFTINQLEQMVVFGQPVFYFEGGAGGAAFQRQAVLTLETGCFVLHPETNAPVRWEELLRLPGGIAPVEWNFRDDIDVGVIGVYSEQNKLVGTEFFGLPHAKTAAGHYLRGLAKRYMTTGGETRQYIGIVPHDPDGYCQQLSVQVGGGGATTIVSGNTEHHPAILDYPARRLAENLPPNAQAALINMIERDFTVKPKEAK